MRRRLLNLPNRRTLVARRRGAALTIFARQSVRTLTFDPTDRKYDFAYQSCVYGEPPKDRTESKLLGVLTDKLERIGQLVPLLDVTGNPRSPNRNEIRVYDTPGGGVVVLEEAEYDLLVRRVTSIITTTIPAFARDVERTLAWLEATPKQDATDLAGRPDEPAGLAGH